MKTNQTRGFIKTVIIIVVAIIILSYYGVDLKNIFTSNQVQSNLEYVWSLVVAGWEVLIEYIWEPFTNFLNINN